MTSDGRESARIYADAILAEAPRVIGLIDRDPTSPTVGCGDRTYWAWKFTDFPASRMQEAVSVLAFLYRTPLEGSPFHGNAALRHWIEQALGFWTRIQHGDGSFDEAYPFERSLAATAFTTFYVGEALDMVGEEVSPAIRKAAVEAVGRAGEWLTRNDETHGFLSNHLAAAAGALMHAHRLTGGDRFARRAAYFLDRILERQSPEGWYDEYGGADPGYQTHGSFYLARCAELANDGRLAASLARASAFVAHFIHPDGSIGGEYASRNTQTYYPAAFEMLAAADPASAWIAETMRPSATSGAAATLRSADVFNYFPFLNNFVFAYRAAASRGPLPSPPPDPTPASGLSVFPQAGLARMRTDRYDAFVGTAKGSVFSVFDRRRRALVESDCGYVGRLRSGVSVSTQYHDPARLTRIGDRFLEVEGVLSAYSRPTMTTPMFVAFRLFTWTVGRSPGLARWLKARLVKTLIYRRRAIGIRFARRLDFEADRIRVRDSLQGPDGSRIASLRRVARFTTIHMGSSRYFTTSELAPMPDDDPVEVAGLAGGVQRERSVVLGD